MTIHLVTASNSGMSAPAWGANMRSIEGAFNDSAADGRAVVRRWIKATHNAWLVDVHEGVSAQEINKIVSDRMSDQWSTQSGSFPVGTLTAAISGEPGMSTFNDPRVKAWLKARELEDLQRKTAARTTASGPVTP